MTQRQDIHALVDQVPEDALEGAARYLAALSQTIPAEERLPSPPELQALRDRLDAIRARKREAIQRQAYEEAAELRDEEERVRRQMDTAEQATWKARFENPLQINGEEDPRRPQGQRCRLDVTLTPYGETLRERFRMLVAHIGSAELPLVWDFSTQIVRHAIFMPAAPMHIVTTVYGLRADGRLDLVWRNWGEAGDLAGAG